jgi:hypothetical protein
LTIAFSNLKISSACALVQAEEAKGSEKQISE